MLPSDLTPSAKVATTQKKQSDGKNIIWPKFSQLEKEFWRIAYFGNNLNQALSFLKKTHLKRVREQDLFLIWVAEGKV